MQEIFVFIITGLAGWFVFHYVKKMMTVGDVPQKCAACPLYAKKSPRRNAG